MLADIAAGVAIFLVVLVALSLVTRMLSKRVKDSSLGPLDSSLGLLFGFARGAAALIQDLKQRGLFDETIIVWGTEFGRMPCAQGKGRDHNPFGFTNWLAGGGIQGGVTYGPSDEWGYKPADRSSPTYCYDVHATILHLLGIDHRRLTVRNNGIDRRLTDVHGHVIREILA